MERSEPTVSNEITRMVRALYHGLDMLLDFQVIPQQLYDEFHAKIPRRNPRVKATEETFTETDINRLLRAMHNALGMLLEYQVITAQIYDDCEFKLPRRTCAIAIREING
jgi:hypothetical protein